MLPATPTQSHSLLLQCSQPTQPLVAGPSVGGVLQKVKFKLEPSQNGQARGQPMGIISYHLFSALIEKLRAERVTKSKGTQLG